MDELIFDRTESDVAYAKENQSSDYYLKGAINYTDLNRVEEWCEYLSEQLNIYSYPTSIVTKTNWTANDNPNQAQLERIRSNVYALKTAFYAITNVPTNLNKMTFKKANDIEKILYELNDNMERMIQAFVYSNEIMAGEV